MVLKLSSLTLAKLYIEQILGLDTYSLVLSVETFSVLIDKLGSRHHSNIIKNCYNQRLFLELLKFIWQNEANFITTDYHKDIASIWKNTPYGYFLKLGPNQGQFVNSLEDVLAEILDYLFYETLKVIETDYQKIFINGTLSEVLQFVISRKQSEIEKIKTMLDSAAVLVCDPNHTEIIIRPFQNVSEIYILKNNSENSIKIIGAQQKIYDTYHDEVSSSMIH